IANPPQATSGGLSGAKPTATSSTLSTRTPLQHELPQQLLRDLLRVRAGIEGRLAGAFERDAQELPSDADRPPGQPAGHFDGDGFACAHAGTLRAYCDRLMTVPST